MISATVATIVAAATVLTVCLIGGYRLPVVLRDETVVRTPETYLLGALIGWTMGLLFGALLGSLVSGLSLLLPSVAGGAAGCAGITIGIIARAVVTGRRARKAQQRHVSK